MHVHEPKQPQHNGSSGQQAFSKARASVHAVGALCVGHGCVLPDSAVLCRVPNEGEASPSLNVKHDAFWVMRRTA